MDCMKTYPCPLICQTIDFVEIYRTNAKTASKKVSRDMCSGKYWNQINVVWIIFVILSLNILQIDVDTPTVQRNTRKYRGSVEAKGIL